MRATILNLLLWPLLLSTGAAQAPAPRVLPYPIPLEQGWVRALERGTRTNDGVPGPDYWTNHSHYVINATLDPETANVSGTISITYTNRSPNEVNALMVHLRQNLHAEGALRNRRVEITGGMNVTDVSWSKNGEEAENIRPRIRGTTLRLRLPRDARLATGESGTISMKWSFRVPQAGRAPRMGHEDHHIFFLGYWYPQMAVMEDVANWVADPYMGNGEFYMGYGDYDLNFTVPKGFIVRATGELTNPEEVLTKEQHARWKKAAEGDEVVNIVTAEEMSQGATTASTTSGMLTWKFHAENVRDCAVSTSDRYVWDAGAAKVKDKHGPGKDGTCMIHAVYEPRARNWSTAVRACRHTIEYMSKEMFPYPWPHMTVCEGIIGGGMEYPMMTICGSPGSARGLHSLVAHETIHMWFPMIVGTNEKRWSWMDEGLTSYMESRSTADFFGDERPERQDMGSYRSFARRGRELPAMQHSDLFPRAGGAYGFATYTKTAAVMHQLRHMAGPERFDAAMRTYVNSWAYKHPYPHDLFNIMEKELGMELDWYFRIWFYEAWTMDYAIASVETSSKGTVVTIADTGLALGPVVVEARYPDRDPVRKTVPVDVWLSGTKEAQLTFEGQPTSITLDPDRTSLDINFSNNKHPQ